MPAFVRYRLPHQTLIHEFRSVKSAIRCPSLEEIPNTLGYLFAPFLQSEATPLWFIPADEHHTWEQPQEIEPFSSSFIADTESRSNDGMLVVKEAETEREDYARAFAACQAALREGEVEKVVLSRTLQVHFQQTLTPAQQEHLFHLACLSYPHSFISLVVFPEAWGSWLMATPEVLLSADKTGWRTMALAGTMENTPSTPLLPEAWSDKDQREQQWVANFIRERLETLGCRIRQSSTYVRPAARLLHLCTDFHIEPEKELSLPLIISALHPTPAVCGWPADKAKSLIQMVESHDRGYYSGFSGPVSPEESHLYVTLRCMHLTSSIATLYAGGGLLKESQESAEWQETERKLGTMLRLFSLPSTT